MDQGVIHLRKAPSIQAVPSGERAARGGASLVLQRLGTNGSALA